MADIYYPPEWGDPSAMYDDSESWRDALWRVWSESLKNNARGIEDKTCGFDYNNVCFQVSGFTSIEDLDRRIEWSEKQLRTARKRLLREQPESYRCKQK